MYRRRRDRDRDTGLKGKEYACSKYNLNPGQGISYTGV